MTNTTDISRFANYENSMYFQKMVNDALIKNSEVPSWKNSIFSVLKTEVALTLGSVKIDSGVNNGCRVKFEAKVFLVVEFYKNKKHYKKNKRTVKALTVPYGSNVAEFHQQIIDDGEYRDPISIAVATHHFVRGQSPDTYLGMSNEVNVYTFDDG